MFRLFKKENSRTCGPPSWIIVGLGNPGSKYEGTRHNIGYAALDRLADSLDITVDRIKFKSLCGTGTLGSEKVLLLKPTTFMNLSGQAVTEAMNFYKIPVDHVIVFCDDINLPVGKMRIRAKGSDGGHNGLKNIIYLTESDQFPRVRIGVGQKPHPDMDLADWVLGRFPSEDTDTIKKLIENIPAICEYIIKGDIPGAMSRYNR